MSQRGHDQVEDLTETCDICVCDFHRRSFCSLINVGGKKILAPNPAYPQIGSDTHHVIQITAPYHKVLPEVKRKMQVWAITRSP